MRWSFFLTAFLIFLVTVPFNAAGAQFRVRTGNHDGLFRVVVEGPDEAIVTIDLGEASGDRREIVIRFQADTWVELPDAEVWKASPVRSVRMEDGLLLLIADPSAELKKTVLRNPDRLVLDFTVAGPAPTVIRELFPRRHPSAPPAKPAVANVPEPDSGPTPSARDDRGEGPATAPAIAPAGTDEETGPEETITEKPAELPPLDTLARRIHGLKRVALDPGHGGYDGGLPGEKDFALRVAVALKELLGREGIRTVLTRTGNRYVSLPERVRLLSAFRPTVYFSIHADRKGFRVYTGPRRGMRKTALALRTRLEVGAGTLFGDDTVLPGRAPTALVSRVPYPGALVEFPLTLAAAGDSGVEQAVRVILDTLAGDWSPRRVRQEEETW